MNNKSLSSSSSPLNWGAFKIAGIYLLVGSLWILFSDRLAERIALNKAMFTSLSIYKGWGYVIVTAFLLYWLIQRHTSRLHASEKQLQLVINALPVLISYVDKNQRYQFANEAYEEWFGEKAQGKHIEELVGQVIYQKVSKYIDKALRGETVTYETEIPYPDGSERFVSATYVPDIAANGQVRGFFSLVQDISEQKEARGKLRLWADAFEGCAHGIAIGDPDTNRIVVCNPAFANMHKCRVEDIVGASILSLYAPSEHEHVRRNIERADQIGHVRYEALMTRRGKDDALFPAEMDLVSVLGEDGELLYRVATAQDISERRQAEDILRRFELLSQNSRDIILFMRYDNGRILEANAAAMQAYGYRRDELLALTIQDLRASDAQGLTIDQMAQADAGGILFESTHQRKDGTTFPVEVSSQGATIGGERTLISIVRDITERRQAEEELSRSEERYRYLFENNPHSMWIYDRKTFFFLDVNEAAIEKYGYSRQEFLNMTIVDIRPPEDVKRLMNNLAQPRQPMEHSAGWKHRLKDGTIIDVEITSHTVEIDGHESALVVAQDITQRKWAEEQLEHSNQKLNEILVSIQDDFYVLDHDWNFVYASRLFTAKIGKEPQDFVGNNIWEMFPKHVGTVLEENFRLAMQKREVRRFEIGGKYTAAWYRMTAFPSTEGITVIGTDITERKRAEEALQQAHNELELKVQERTAALSQANALLQALMDYTPDQIYFKDTQCRFIRNSRAQARLLGLSDPLEVIGKTDFDFFPHAAKAYAEEQEVMKTGKSLEDFEEWVVWPDGRETWVSTTKVPLRNSDGETIGIFGISRDITERKRGEQAIRQLNSDLEKQAAQLQVANKELEAFSYSVSHDLRAPLRAIDGYTRILVEDYEANLDVEGKRVCGVISAEARRMGQLIDDLLAFSRLGRKEMFSSSVDMKDLVVSVLNELIKEGDRERIDFKIARLPSVRADSSLMRQVWLNLLSNALKFTSKKDRAAIEVGCKSSREEVVYYVHDTGAGFDMEYADKLFGVFQRLHSENEFDGTGVGLAIVQRIIRRHGGRVWAEGEVDKGATFYFALPRKENHHE